MNRLQIRLFGPYPNSLWAHSFGYAIDLLIEERHRILSVEVKSGQTVADDFLKLIKRWDEIAGEAAGPAMLVYGDTEVQERTDCKVIPWR